MAIVNISTANDADFSHGFVYQQAVGGAPFDLTGNTLRMGVRHHASDIEEQMLLTTENGGLVITDAPNGRFTLFITRTQFQQQLPVGSYDHSLIRISGSQWLRIWSGTLTVAAGPSR